MRRRRGPGLMGTMARTAVIAGTASAVSNASSNKMAAQAQAQADQRELAALQQQAQVDAAVQRALEQQSAPDPVAAPAAGGMTAPERIAALQQLAALHTQGILTDAELATEKARILAG